MTSEAQTAENKADLKQRLAEVPVTHDIVTYTLECVQRLAPRTSAEVVAAVERQVRETYGGEVKRISNGYGTVREERDAQIKRDYLAGERMALLERRYELTKRRLFQIIKS